MKNLLWLIAAALTAFSGCGSGEDFSKPPSAIQASLSKTAATTDEAPLTANADQKVSDAGPGETSVNKPEEGSSSASGPNRTTPETGTQPPTAESGSVDGAASASLSGKETKPDNAPSGALPPETPDVAAADKSNGTSPAVAEMKPETPDVMTASGKPAAEIEKKKEENSKKTVAGNAGGLLSSLVGKPSPDPDAPADVAVQSVTRFGRFALSRGDWLKLVSRLSRRFFVAATPDGTRIAASAGERHAQVVNTQIDILFDRRAISRGETKQSVVQSLHGLQGTINSLELTFDGNLALVGTTDGRLLARSAASTRDWDLFARDLFLYQDEHRRSAKLSDQAIVVVRVLPNGKVLTIDGDGVCSLWSFDTAVHKVTNVKEMTAEQAAASVAETVRVQPSCSVPVSGYQILNVAVSETGETVAVVSSAETITLFNTETGAVLDTLNTSHFVDALPVCVQFLADKNEVLVGLADGRILRRAFGDGPPVSATIESGMPVDYDAVYVPGPHDPPDPVTAMCLVPGTTMIYFGTLEGDVFRYDMTQRQIEQTAKRHDGAVLEFRLTDSGVISIGDDRKAELFDIPLSAVNQDPEATRTFLLPRDITLQEEPVDSEQTETGMTSAKSTRPVIKNAQPVTAEVDLSLSGIRPPDATMALLEHQLRVTSDAEKKLDLRQQILRHQGQMSLADSLGKDSAEATSDGPQQVFQVTTEFLYDPENQDNWRRVVLALSDDGMTAVSLHRTNRIRSEPFTKEEAVEVRDLATGTTLRRWTQPGLIRNIHFNIKHQQIFPTGPSVDQLSMTDGKFLQEVGTTYLTCTAAPDQETIVFGHFGQSGVAADSITRLNLDDGATTSGLELFESLVSAVAFSRDAKSLYASTRGREHTRLLELDPLTFAIRSEISKEELKGVMTTDSGMALDLAGGDTILVPSPSNNILMTWATHAGGLQLRLWRRGKNGWPKELVTVLSDTKVILDRGVDCPAAFVSHQDSRLALITTTGVLILDTKKVRLEAGIPVQNIGTHRPVFCFSPDNNWVLTGDGDGYVWALSLTKSETPPRRFSAHSGPISGVAMSPNGRYLITAGEDNRLRTWRVNNFLK